MGFQQLICNQLLLYSAQHSSYEMEVEDAYLFEGEA